jgi:hypothetical protein
MVGLAPEVVRHHGRRGFQRRGDRDLLALALQRLDQAAEIAVTGEEHEMVDVVGHLHGIHRELEVHVALHLAPALRIGEFLQRLCHDPVAVVVEPIDQRPERRIFLIVRQRRVVDGADEVALLAEIGEQPPVVDVEAERARGGIEVGAVDQDGDLFARVEHGETPK